MKLTGIILFVTLLVACEPKSQSPPSYFCRPELEAFFAGPDSLPVIEFKHTDSFEVVEKILIEKTDWEKETSVAFRIPFQPDSLHKPVFVKIILHNHNNAIICFSLRNIIDIRINSLEWCLIEREVEKPDKVRTTIIDNLLNFGRSPSYAVNPQKTVLRLIWDPSISSAYFDDLIKKAIDGYSDAVNIYSIRKYSQSFCDLDSSRADTVINALSFNLELGNYSLYPIPVGFEQLD